MEQYKKNNNDKSLARLIKETEDFFVKGNEGDVYRLVIDVVEKSLIEKALEKAYGNQIRTAKILGINRNTLHSKIKRLNIDVSKFRQ